MTFFRLTLLNDPLYPICYVAVRIESHCSDVSHYYSNMQCAMHLKKYEAANEYKTIQRDKSLYQ